jgi:hypothetical protein
LVVECGVRSVAADGIDAVECAVLGLVGPADGDDQAVGGPESILARCIPVQLEPPSHAYVVVRPALRHRER